MTNNTLRMQIVTALDNAGIKATEEQLNGLEKSLKKLNQQGQTKFGALFNLFGKFPGKIGQAARAIGGLDKAAGSVSKVFPSLNAGISGVGASAGGISKVASALGGLLRFAGPIAALATSILALPKVTAKAASALTDGTGVFSFENMKNGLSKSISSMGTWIGDKFKNFFTAGLHGAAKEAEKEAEKLNIETPKIVDELNFKAVDNSVSYQVKQMKTLQSEQDKVLANIKKQTSEYLSQASSLANLQDSRNDAKIIQMERQKMEDAAELYNAGYSQEVIDQNQKVWDMYIAKRKIQLQDSKGNAEYIAATAKAEGTAKMVDEAMKATDQAEKRVAAIQDRLAKLDVSGNTPQMIKRREALEEKLRAAQEIYDKARDNESSLMVQLNNERASAAEIDQKRVNDKARAWNALGYQVSDYNRFVMQNGDQAGYGVFGEDLNSDYNAAYDELKQVNQNTADLAEMLRSLLQMK